MDKRKNLRQKKIIYKVITGNEKVTSDANVSKLLRINSWFAEHQATNC